MKFLITFTVSVIILLHYFNSFVNGNFNEIDNINNKYVAQPVPNYLIDGAFYTKVDHFTPQDTRKMKFNYKLNLIYYRNGGPLFVYINAGTIDDTEYIENGLIVNLAQELGGALVTYNHRYYKDNIPTETASFDDMKYLTIEQNLSDLATLIFNVKKHLGPSINRKTIAWGSGYGASLAIWGRVKYPHLIDVAWGSSALLLPISIGPDFLAQLSSIILGYGGVSCYVNLFLTFIDVYFYLITLQQPLLMQQIFNTCDPVDIESDMDVQMFHYKIIELLSIYLSEHDMHGMIEMCRAIDTEINELLEAFGRWIQFEYAANDCLDFNYEKLMAKYSDENWYTPGTDSGVRQWYYRSCTQFGFLTTTPGASVFQDVVHEEFHENSCEIVLGESYNVSKLESANNKISKMYGGYDMPTNKMIFTDGELSGWKVRTIPQIANANDDADAFRIPYASRASDLSSIVGWESRHLTIAKQRILNSLRSWILED